MSFPSEIQARLTDQGITETTVVGSRVFLPTEGKVIHLMEYAGQTPWRTHNTGAAVSYVRPAMQIVAHAPELEDARTLIYRIRDAVTIRNMFLSGTWYLFIEPNGEPRDSGMDGNDRATFTLNIGTLKRPS